MLSDRVRPWKSAFWRGLLCLIVVSAFASSGQRWLDRPIEHSTHNQMNAGDNDDPASFRGSETPRIVHRDVGVDHLAINAAVPGRIVQSMAGPLVCHVDAASRVHRSDAEHGSASVRGPPTNVTI
jgi:hypothetical protein